MATIRPFRALRPIPERAVDVASVPYDVVDSGEAKVLAGGNRYSFLHVIRPEIDLDDSVDLYDPRVNEQGAENLRSMTADGVLVDEPEPCLYLYRLSANGQTQTGIVACCAVDEYEDGTIKKHEHTRREKEEDRFRHMLALSAHTGPVLMTYRNMPGLDRKVNSMTDASPLYDFTAEDGVRHTIWKIWEYAHLVELFHKVPSIYIADGHHRTAAANRVRTEMRSKNPTDRGELEFNYFLTVLFPSEQLRILAYNRYIRDLNGMGRKEYTTRIEELFNVQRGEAEPMGKGSFGMYLDGVWYILCPKSGIEQEYRLTVKVHDPVASLDLSLFQEVLLEPVLGIRNQKKDKRIEFIGGEDSVSKIERRVDEEGGVGFTFFPVSVDELLAVADAGEIMPPKSTWFSPKLRSGLLIHRF